MLISKRVAFSRVILRTAKTLIYLVPACVATYFLDEYLLRHKFNFPFIIPAILGPAMAFFIGFNNNQAYDRWWEARKIWGGLVNTSRTYARQILQYTKAGEGSEENELAKYRQRTVKRHLAFLYALKSFLRSSEDKEHRQYLSDQEAAEVEKEKNVHNAILSLQSRDLQLASDKGWVDGFRFMEIDRSITGLCDEMGKSERIKTTVFPTSYLFYTRLFIWVFIITSMFEFIDLVGAWSMLFGTLVGYVFLVSHSLGFALMDPFEQTPYGISLDAITRTIEINLLEMLGEEEIPEPVKPVKKLYIT